MKRSPIQTISWSLAITKAFLADLRRHVSMSLCSERALGEAELFHFCQTCRPGTLTRPNGHSLPVGEGIWVNSVTLCNTG